MPIRRPRLRKLTIMLLCALLAACGGGGGGGGEIVVPGPDPVPPVEPDPPEEPDPTEKVDVTSSNYEEYLAHAKDAWQEYGGGGLTAVIAALEDDGKPQYYDYDQVVDFVRNLRQYQTVLAKHGFGGQPVSNFDHPFTLTNVHKAMAAGLTGAGQKIAFYDAGFDINHPDLVGKDIDCGRDVGQHGAGEYGVCSDASADDHGTATATIAAGGGPELIGVAPEAGLVLFDWNEIHLISAIYKARESGAVSFNNSWGDAVLNNGEDGCIRARGQPPNWQCFYVPISTHPSVKGYGRIADAFEAYQDVGVVVFAKSNLNPDPEFLLDRYEVASDLPHFYENLQGAWISVVNARIKTDGNGGVQEIHRDSAPCNLSAPWCLVGNGHMTVAQKDGTYGSWTGTSYVAPQVAGAVALLAEAFPTLNPAGWTARLLATANNAWFIEPGGIETDVSGTIGERCWNEGEANEVCHAYSQEWGHGIMDLEAALLPIGGQFIVNGAHLTGASRIKLETASLIAPSHMLAPLQQALSVPLTTFDALNGNFAINAAGLVGERDAPSGAISLLRRFDRQPIVQDDQQLAVTLGEFSYSASHQTSAEGLPSEFALQHMSSKTGAHVGFGFTSSDVTTQFGGLTTAGHAFNPTGFAGLLGDTAYATLGIGGQASAFGGLAALASDSAARGHAEGATTLSLFGFAAENANNSDGQFSGFGARIGVQFDNTQLEVSTSLAVEEGSYLGIAGDESVWFGGSTSLAAGQIALTHDLNENLHFIARAELGSLSGGADEGDVGLISQMDRTLYSGFEVSLEQTDLFIDNDALALWVSQPIRVEDSNMTLTLASGRTKAGDIEYIDYQTDITPDERQIDLGLSYSFRSENGLSEARFGVMQSFNHGHMQDEYATSIAAKYSMRF